MTVFLVTLAMVALFTIFSVRHFFVQLIAIKLLMDDLIFILNSVRNSDQASLHAQTTAMLVAALSALVFFVLMAAGIHRFGRTKGADLEVRGD